MRRREMNIQTYEKLQYNELKEVVKSYCVSTLGKNLVNQLQPTSNLKVVKTRLQETTEARRLLDAENHIPLMGVSNIHLFIQKLEKGIILEPVELVSVVDFLRGCRKIKTFMGSKQFFAPLLCAYGNSMTEFRTLEEEIMFSIKGNRVDSAASKELRRIRKQIEATESKIEERLGKFLKSSVNKEYIQDFFISKKNDRYTIPIKASFKNHVSGTIVEISSKGSTVFIEPAAITKLNEELAMYKAEEAMEEYQILATLSGMILEKIAAININMELIGQYDCIFAKGKYSKSIDGREPLLNEHGYFRLVQCKHPLLKGNVVPLDFEIGKDYRSLIITGPNAGGKTVVLKTVGLLTLAVMSGFHIYGEQETEISIFDYVFVDIGDSQSMENALSTFSSHIKNIAEIMNQVNHRTLLLFDEIGSGTEPTEGTALAIAILEQFYQMGCMTVATTHYGEIKRYSELHSDFMNAAMQFNQDSLEPLYKLLIGQSGESNALWISKKMNLRQSVIEKARSYMTNKEYDMREVDQSKIKPTLIKEQVSVVEKHEYVVGDRVKVLDSDTYGLIYQPKDRENNVVILHDKEFVTINVKRIELNMKATELYPEGYDMNTLFQSFKERKQNHDIKRGSKKALRQIQKEMRKE